MIIYLPYGHLALDFDEMILSFDELTPKQFSQLLGKTIDCDIFCRNLRNISTENDAMRIAQRDLASKQDAERLLRNAPDLESSIVHLADCVEYAYRRVEAEKNLFTT